MRCVVGLGNPTEALADTRHNIGWVALDEVSSRYGFGPWGAVPDGVAARGRIGSEDVVLVKPTTWMNDSGVCVRRTLDVLGLGTADLVVVHDDLDLGPGAVRAKVGGRPGGHNGLKSVDAEVGADYARIRLGIGHPRGRMPVIDYVLGSFEDGERAWVDALARAVAAHVHAALAGDLNAFVAAVRADPALAAALAPEAETAPVP